MSYVDYKEVKAMTTLDWVASWLGLKTHNNRTQCPIAMGDKRELVIDHKRDRFWCYGCKQHATKASDWCGDLIQLVAHVNGTTQKQAALAIQKAVTGYEPARKGLPDGGFQDLDHAHEKVRALGISPERAQELGIGYRNRGTTRDAVLFPLRDARGALLGYVIYAKGEMKLPNQLKDLAPK